jgi:1,4-alpha-glucan branching enzyme
VRDLNTAYRAEPALHELDCDPAGFEWVDCNDWEQSTLCFLRKGKSPQDMVVAAFNFTPVPRHNYRVGVPKTGAWEEMLNSDASLYAGGDVGNLGGTFAEPEPWHGRPFSLRLTLPPLGVVILKPDKRIAQG